MSLPLPDPRTVPENNSRGICRGEAEIDHHCTADSGEDNPQQGISDARKTSDEVPAEGAVSRRPPFGKSQRGTHGGVRRQSCRDYSGRGAAQFRSGVLPLQDRVPGNGRLRHDRMRTAYHLRAGLGVETTHSRASCGPYGSPHRFCRSVESPRQHPCQGRQRDERLLQERKSHNGGLPGQLWLDEHRRHGTHRRGGLRHRVRPLEDNDSRSVGTEHLSGGDRTETQQSAVRQRISCDR